MGFTESRKTKSLPPNLVPIGVSREQAATYVGISTSLFDVLVENGLMPQPRKVGGRRKIWAVSEVQSAFMDLPSEISEEGEKGNNNPWDDD